MRALYGKYKHRSIAETIVSRQYFLDSDWVCSIHTWRTLRSTRGIENALCTKKFLRREGRCSCYCLFCPTRAQPSRAHSLHTRVPFMHAYPSRARSLHARAAFTRAQPSRARAENTLQRVALSPQTQASDIDCTKHSFAPPSEMASFSAALIGKVVTSPDKRIFPAMQPRFSIDSLSSACLTLNAPRLASPRRVIDAALIQTGCARFYVITPLALEPIYEGSLQTFLPSDDCERTKCTKFLVFARRKLGTHSTISSQDMKIQGHLPQESQTLYKTRQNYL